MNRRIQRRLEAYKYELNRRVSIDNRKRWTAKVLNDLEKSSLTASEKACLAKEIIKVYEA